MASLLSKRIIVIADTFEQKLPIGEYGYVIGQIRDTNNAFDYVVRIPKLNREYYVTKLDIELEESFVQRIAEKVQQDALIDFALKTKDKELFNALTGVASEPHTDDSTQPSNEEFVKKVRLNAYI